MSLTYSQYKAAKAHGFVRLGKVYIPSSSGRLGSRWIYAPLALGVPSTPIAPNGSVSGCLNYQQLPGTASWVKTARVGHGVGPFLIYDRLSQMGGLSGIVTGTVTTNLPTAALTRYTSGVGVMGAYEIYTSLGTTASTISCSYTNSAGVAGRTSPLVTFGGGIDRLASVVIPIPLQVGDVGMRSVESVTLTGTTGTAGNYGVTLWKPLALVHCWDETHAWSYDTVRDGGAWFEGIQADACLSHFTLLPGTDMYANSGSLDLIRQV